MEWPSEVSKCYFQEPKTEQLRTAYIKACKAGDSKPKTVDGEGGDAVAAKLAAGAETGDKEVVEDATKDM